MFIFNELSDRLENNYKKICLPCRELPLYSEKLSIKTKIRISTLYTGKVNPSSSPICCAPFFVTTFKEEREKGTTHKCSKALMPFTAASVA